LDGVAEGLGADTGGLGAAGLEVGVLGCRALALGVPAVLAAAGNDAGADDAGADAAGADAASEAAGPEEAGWAAGIGELAEAATRGDVEAAEVGWWESQAAVTATTVSAARAV
jgi:hypothetical protein